MLDLLHPMYQATASYGQLVILGSPRVGVTGDLTEFFSAVHLRCITVRGALEWLVPTYPDVGERTSHWSKQEMRRPDSAMRWLYDWEQG